MHKPESALENERHKILWDVAKKMYRQIPTWRDLMLINKKKNKHLLSNGFCRSGSPQIENKRKRKERQILGPCQRTKKTVEHEGDDDSNYRWSPSNGPKKLEKLEIRGKLETIQTTHCWHRLEYWEESWVPEETCCHSDSSESPAANACVEKE